MATFRPKLRTQYRSYSQSSNKAGNLSRSGTRESSNPSNMNRSSDGAAEASETDPLIPNRSRSQDNRQSQPHDQSFVKKVFSTAWEVLASNYANVLLVFVPLGIIANAVGWDPVTIFILNFLAIVPLAGLLAFATEELAAKLGQTIGGLLNATFGNAVELIVSIIALREGQIRVVQASMLGSVLSNMLLVLGCCFIAGGLKEKEQKFNQTVASTMSSLMAVASASLVIPATLYSVMRPTKGSPEQDAVAKQNVLTLSRATSIILLILYILYLIFQLKTHAKLFEEEDGEQDSNADTAVEDNSDIEQQNEEPAKPESEGKKEGDTLGPVPAAITLVLITVLVALCAEYLVDSIDAIVERAHISKTFIGLVLLPIVGNAAEHVTAVVVSYKGKMDLALGVAIGSSLQIALFVTPFLVVLGWMIGVDMSLKFEGFETVVFFLSVLIVNYLISDGLSNYLEGAMCLGMYAIIAVAFYVYPDNATTDIGVMFKHFMTGR